MIELIPCSERLPAIGQTVFCLWIDPTMDADNWLYLGLSERSLARAWKYDGSWDGLTWARTEIPFIPTHWYPFGLNASQDKAAETLQADCAPDHTALPCDVD